MKITGFESTDSILKELGKRIRQTRIQRNMSQSELASRADISIHTLSNMENGRTVNTDTMITVLRELGCASRIDMLIQDTDIVRPSTIYKKQAERKRVRSRKTTGWTWDE